MVTTQNEVEVPTYLGGYEIKEVDPRFEGTFDSFLTLNATPGEINYEEIDTVEKAQNVLDQLNYLERRQRKREVKLEKMEAELCEKEMAILAREAELETRKYLSEQKLNKQEEIWYNTVRETFLNGNLKSRKA